jgi:ATP-dependent exoDNAse (exonuclease V) alpha subunit
MAAQGLTSERLVEHPAIARANGEKLLSRPALALDAITHNQATFTTRDLAMFVHRHSEGKEQFNRVMAAVKAAPELVALGKDGRGEQRFTSRAMLNTEQRLERATSAMAERDQHAVGERCRNATLARAAARGLALSDEQRSALSHITEAKGLGIVIGYAGTGKSAMLGVAREAWEDAGSLCAASRYRALRLRTWRAARKSFRARSPASSISGARGASCSPAATFW